MTKSNRVPSSKDFERVLRDDVLSPPQLRGLQALFNFPDHSATAPQVSVVLGYKNETGGANSVIGGAGRSIANALGIKAPRASNHYPAWFSVVVEAVGTDAGCLWVMRQGLALSMEKLGLLDPTLGVDLFPDETPGHSRHEEGARLRVEVNIFERSREARERCIAHHGAKCVACGLDFKSVYGDIGKGFIHVHHLVPLSEINKTYIVDPIQDLRPVCPNCHAMIHRREPALTISQLKRLIKQ